MTISTPCMVGRSDWPAPPFNQFTTRERSCRTQRPRRNRISIIISSSNRISSNNNNATCPYLLFSLQSRHISRRHSLSVNTRSGRLLLAQLRSGYCQKLATYHNVIDPVVVLGFAVWREQWGGHIFSWRHRTIIIGYYRAEPNSP